MHISHFTAFSHALSTGWQTMCCLCSISLCRELLITTLHLTAHTHSHAEHTVVQNTLTQTNTRVPTSIKWKYTHTQETCTSVLIHTDTHTHTHTHTHIHTLLSQLSSHGAPEEKIKNRKLTAKSTYVLLHCKKKSCNFYSKLLAAVFPGSYCNLYRTYCNSDLQPFTVINKYIIILYLCEITVYYWQLCSLANTVILRMNSLLL